MNKRLIEIKTELERVVQRGWSFAACARYGEMLAAVQLDPKMDIDLSEMQPKVRDLVISNSQNLVSAWENECKHITQIVRSRFDLNYEELVALLTSLSELAFVKLCLESLGVANLTVGVPPSEQELRVYLTGQGSAYPSSWDLPHTIVMECKEHWWWKKPAR